MFDRSAIFKAAWLHYRQRRAMYAPWQIARGLVDVSFAASLREAWFQAKEEAAHVAREARVEAALSGPAAPIVARVLRELETLSYRPLACNIEVSGVITDGTKLA